MSNREDVPSTSDSDNCSKNMVKRLDENAENCGKNKKLKTFADTEEPPHGEEEHRGQEDQEEEVKLNSQAALQHDLNLQEILSKIQNNVMGLFQYNRNISYARSEDLWMDGITRVDRVLGIDKQIKTTINNLILQREDLNLIYAQHMSQQMVCKDSIQGKNDSQNDSSKGSESTLNSSPKKEDMKKEGNIKNQLERKSENNISTDQTENISDSIQIIDPQQDGASTSNTILLPATLPSCSPEKDGVTESSTGSIEIIEPQQEGASTSNTILLPATLPSCSPEKDGVTESSTGSIEIIQPQQDGASTSNTVLLPATLPSCSSEKDGVTENSSDSVAKAGVISVESGEMVFANSEKGSKEELELRKEKDLKYLGAVAKTEISCDNMESEHPSFRKRVWNETNEEMIYISDDGHKMEKMKKEVEEIQDEEKNGKKEEGQEKEE